MCHTAVHWDTTGFCVHDCKNDWLHENRIITEFQLVRFLPVRLNIIVAWWWLFFLYALVFENKTYWSFHMQCFIGFVFVAVIKDGLREGCFKLIVFVQWGLIFQNNFDFRLDPWCATCQSNLNYTSQFSALSCSWLYLLLEPELIWSMHF